VLREEAMLVEHILADKGHEVITTEPERSLLETARLLDEKRARAVVVSDADHPVLGIISERDIVRALAQGRQRRSMSLSRGT
jgi:CBS domain-containing protein